MPLAKQWIIQDFPPLKFQSFSNGEPVRMVYIIPQQCPVSTGAKGVHYRFKITAISAVETVLAATWNRNNIITNFKFCDSLIDIEPKCLICTLSQNQYNPASEVMHCMFGLFWFIQTVWLQVEFSLYIFSSSSGGPKD